MCSALKTTQENFLECFRVLNVAYVKYTWGHMSISNVFQLENAN